MAKPQKSIMMYECPDCHTQFKGQDCPECGLSKGKIKLAKDGLPQNMHKSDVLFGSVDDLAPSRSIIDNEDSEFLKKRAQYQNEETMDNLRESMLTKSEIKNAELKRELLKSRLALEQFDPVPNGPNTQNWPSVLPLQQNNPSLDQGQQLQGMFNQQSPQSLFMSKFMGMKPDQRSELLEQVADADPNAIQALSSMMTGSQPAMYPYMMQPGMMNPYTMQGMMPQPQKEQTNSDPIEKTVLIMSSMFDMLQKMQPPRDNGLKDTLSEFKNEIVKMNEKVNTISRKEHFSEDQSIRNELNGLKQHLQSVSTKPNVIESIRDLKNLIGELEVTGLINTNHPGENIEDTIRLKETSHKIDMENRKQFFEEETLKAKESKTNLQRQFAQALFQKELQKTIQPKEEIPSPPIMYRNVAHQPMKNNPQNAPPKSVFSEHVSDSGFVQETREVTPKET
uniref:Uncharacterized protein n=1 Tax=viral metagenome TaxID=1070528 RepID=A0A6M3Y5D6_9ZZZZ